MLEHQFWIANTPAQGYWAQQVFKDTYSLRQFENNLEKLAFPKDVADLNGHNPLSAVLGDGFESFGEIFFKMFGHHPDIKVTNLEVCPPGHIGFDFKYCHTNDYSTGTIQSKYVGKGKAWETKLKEGETMKLERFQNASIQIGGVSVDATENLIVFTNATGIDYFTEDVLLYGKVRCVGRKHIEFLTKDNLAFWDTARNWISKTNHYINF